jgi:hypothetical protein
MNNTRVITVPLEDLTLTITQQLQVNEGATSPVVNLSKDELRDWLDHLVLDLYPSIPYIVEVLRSEEGAAGESTTQEVVENSESAEYNGCTVTIAVRIDGATFATVDHRTSVVGQLLQELIDHARAHLVYAPDTADYAFDLNAHSPRSFIDVFGLGGLPPIVLEAIIPRRR